MEREMTISFKVVPSNVRNEQVVEVLKDGAVCCVIYPSSPVGDIRVVSAHFAGELAAGDALPDGVIMDNGEHTFPPIPAVHIRFDPRPYVVGFNRIERATKQ